MSTRSSFLYIESEETGFDLHIYHEGTDGTVRLEITTKDLVFNHIIPQDAYEELKEKINWEASG